jgi:hypothetical protein
VRILFSVLLLTSTIWAGQTVAISGEISDSQCAFNVHSNASSHEELLKSGIVGRTPKQCTQACVRMGGKYVLVDTVNKKVYHLANPEKTVDFAGMHVRVNAVIDEKGLVSIVGIEAR